MSLKAFHLFFIIISLLLSVGFGIWCVDDYLSTENRTSLFLGIGSFIVAALLVPYLLWFLKKLKNVGFLCGALFVSLVPKAGLACAVCVGNPNSPLTKSANAAVVFLLAVVGLVLAGFAGLFIFWGRRAKRLQ